MELLTPRNARPPFKGAEPILTGYRGSQAHGTYIPPEEEMGTDDEDWFMVYRFPTNFYLGLDGYRRKDCGFNNINEETGIDIVGHDVRHYVDLLLKGSPNVHAWLWTDSVHPQIPAGVSLIVNREMFLSKRVLRAIGGYALGQYERMSKENTDKAFMGERRRKMMEQYGYNVKNAAHCIRLLHCGEVLAREGWLPVKLEDPVLDLVMQIKRGEMGKDSFLTYFDYFLKSFRDAESACTCLPKSPNYSKINTLLVEELLCHSNQ